MAENRLCSICDRIQFDKRRGYITTVGSMQHISSNRNCPFCRLLAFALFNIQRTEERKPDSELGREIALIWNDQAGFPDELTRHGFILLLKSVSSNGILICFVRKPRADPLAQPWEFFLPVVEPQIDTRRVRGWMSTCERSHGSTCIPDRKGSLRVEEVFSGLSVLRLVDVELLCIVEQHTHCRYVALSYVWGGTQSLRLTRATRKKLMEPQALGRIMVDYGAQHTIPKTIRDAIDLVRSLGERYLWVDSLCLVQNDPEDVEHGVKRMDRIYEHSTLTIIAASGVHANIGLPGVQPGSRHAAQVIEQLRPGISMGVYTSLENLLWPTVYSTRGWTFQERLLSNRALIFIDNQLYFQCRQRTFSENCDDVLSQQFHDVGQYTTHYYAPSKHIKMEEPMRDYMSLLEFYTKRTFTYQGDVLRALEGIMRRFSKRLNCRFFQGMPRTCFDLFFFFSPTENVILRRCSKLPSYSWAGWSGSMKFPIPLKHIDESERDKHTWIEWHKRRSSGAVSLVWDPAADDGFSGHDRSIRKQRYSFKSKLKLAFPTTRTQPSDSIGSLIVPVEYPLLCFWTLSAFFSIADVDTLNGTALLTDRDGTLCGKMCMDGYEEGTFFDDTETVEFIAISAFGNTHSFEPLGTSVYNKLSMSGKDVYQVLCLEWRDGIAERRGAGEIIQSAFERSLSPGPSWKEIYLS